MRLLHYHGRVRGLFLASLVLLLLASGLTAAKAWLIQPVVDTFRRQGATPRDLLLLCGGIFALFLLQAVLTFAHSMLSRMAGSRIVRAMREDLFAHLLRQGSGWCAARGSSDLASRVVNDVAAFETAAVTDLQALLRDVATLLLLFGVLLWQSRPLAFLCLLVLAAVGLLLFAMNRRIRGLSRRVQETVSGISRQLAEMIGGLEVVLTFGLAPRWRDRFRKLNAEHYGTGLRLQRAGSAGVAAVQAVMGLGLAALVFLTGRALLRGEITEGQFLSFLGTLYLMQAPAVDVGQRVANLSRGLVAGARALELFEDEPARDEPLDPLPLPDGGLGFSFRSVTFGHGSQNRQPLLRDVSFEVSPGELVVLMGESGGGKTTIARLLLRFLQPWEGNIFLGGVPLGLIRRRDLSRAVSYVAQDVFLFEGTIRDNVRVGRPDASDAEVAAVLRTCCLERFVAELPRGLDTPVSERGLQLSGGQRQRIAIARALLVEPRLLVLDEATSALDTEMERRLFRALAESARRCTVFAITHRPGAAELADRVLVLRDGRLASDDHALLAASSSRRRSGTRSRSRPVSSR